MGARMLQESKYNTVKGLLSERMTKSKICDLLNVSWHTVTAVDEANNYQEYINAKRERLEAHFDDDKRKMTNVSEMYMLNRICGQLKEQNERLTTLTGYLRECASTLNQINDMLK